MEQAAVSVEEVELVNNAEDQDIDPTPTFEDVQGSKLEAFGSPATPSLSTPPVSKQLGFADDIQTSVPVPLALKNVFEAASEPDYNAFIKDVLLWTNIVRSVFYLVGGFLLIYVTSVIAQFETPLIANVCFAGLLSLGLNFVRNFLTRNTLQQNIWVGSWWTNWLKSSFVNTVNAVAELHDKHAHGIDPIKSLKVVFVLWSVSMGARVLGPFALLHTVYASAFILPSVYRLQKAKIDEIIQMGFQSAQDLLVKLDIKTRLAAFVLPLLLTFACSRIDGCIAILALALYGASLLKPAQVEDFQKKAEPLLATAQKTLHSVSTFAGDVAVKYELTPTPKKAKPE